MAAGAFTPYHAGILNICKQNIDFENDTIIAALVDNAYTPDATVHNAWDDVSAYECGDADYSEQTLSTNPIALVGGKVVFDAQNVDFSPGDNADISARYLVLYKDSGVPSTSYLIGYVDLNDGGSTNVSSINADFSLAWNAAGIYRITP